MSYVHESSGFTSEPSRFSVFPHTPPHTPHRAKRIFARSESPASIRSASVQPTETTSPTKKATKQSSQTNDVHVEELTEQDPGYFADVDVVYPDELEEVESTTENDDTGSLQSEGSETDITKDFSRLGCDANVEEAKFEQQRRQKHRHKRDSSRLFKRSHSQSLESNDTETTDPDAMADQDRLSSARRLRRRVYGPDGVRDSLEKSPDQLPTRGQLGASADAHAAHTDATDETMDIDVPET